MSTYILKFKRDKQTLLDDDWHVTFSGNEQAKRAFLQVVLMLNLQSSGYAVWTIHENLDEVLREQGSGTLHSKYLYMMKIYGNSGYERDGLSLVAMLISIYLNLLFTFFGPHVEKFCYHILCYLWTFPNFFFNFTNNSPVRWLSFSFSVIESCRECLHCEFWQESDTQLLEP